MTLLRSQNRDLTHWIVMLAVGISVYLIGCHFAHAGVAAADPTPALTTATDAGWATLAQDGPWWLAVALVHVALRTFLARQHWLQQGRLLTGLTALAGVCAAIVAWHWQGAPSVGILTALIAGGTLLLHPAPVSPPSKSSSVLVASILVAFLVACSATQARQTAAAGAVGALDCEAAHLDAQVLADARALADAEVQRWIGGAAPADLDSLRAKLIADLAPIKSDLGRCAIAGALAAAAVLVQPAVPGTSVSALVAMPGPDPAQVRAAFALAARQLGWAPVKVSGGQVL